VTIPIVTNKKIESEIIHFRTKELLQRHNFDFEVEESLIDILLQTFEDMRVSFSAATNDEERLESALSTAEQIGVLEDAILHSNLFDKSLDAKILAKSLVGSLVRRSPQDVSIMNKFWHNVLEKKEDKTGDWEDFIKGGQDIMAIMK